MPDIELNRTHSSTGCGEENALLVLRNPHIPPVWNPIQFEVGRMIGSVKKVECHNAATNRAISPDPSSEAAVRCIPNEIVNRYHHICT